MQLMGTSIRPLEFWKRNLNGPSPAHFATSALATAFRGGAGTYVVDLGARPSRRLTLYEMEGCPYSRKAREALSMLDIDVNIKPCPRGESRHRRELVELIGEERVPVLVDPDTGWVIAESDKIVEYLFIAYGDGEVPWQLRFQSLTDNTSTIASKLRGDPGTERQPAESGESRLELWGFEGSPYCRPVRECLSTLALPYILHNVARDSPKRAAFVKRAGKMQVPFLYDPNTGVAMFESEAIRSYLFRVYGRVS